MQTQKDLNNVIKQSAPWYVRNKSTYSRGVIVHFENGSSIEIISPGVTCRGRRFNCLYVDKRTDVEVQEKVLKRLMCDYPCDDAADCEDLIAYAEFKLNTALEDWQRDMLISLKSGISYMGSRIAGKKTMTDIYVDWLNGEEMPNSCSYEITYDELINGTACEKTDNQIVV